jgi:curved DNA-binding protein CbpA
MSTRSATHYELIGLSREASADEIKAAFRTQAQIHHPDAGGDTESFAALSAAHDVLSDPVRRSDYDATLPAAGSTRFSGWSRPAASETSADANDLPRRRPTVDDAGDDPMVFRRRADEAPSPRSESLASEEEAGRGFGSVTGIEEAPMAASDEPAAPMTASDERPAPLETVVDEAERPLAPRPFATPESRAGEDELDRHDRTQARRFRFFGRERDGDDPADSDRTVGADSIPDAPSGDSFSGQTPAPRDERPTQTNGDSWRPERDQRRTDLAGDDWRPGQERGRGRGGPTGDEWRPRSAGPQEGIAGDEWRPSRASKSGELAGDEWRPSRADKSGGLVGDEWRPRRAERSAGVEGDEWRSRR